MPATDLNILHIPDLGPLHMQQLGSIANSLTEVQIQSSPHLVGFTEALKGLMLLKLPVDSIGSSEFAVLRAE